MSANQTNPPTQGEETAVVSEDDLKRKEAKARYEKSLKGKKRRAEYKARTREKQRAWHKDFYERHKHEITTRRRRYFHDYGLLKRYGMSSAEWEQRAEAQNRRCAICETHETERRLVVDHCHRSNKVRALLCDHCNVGIARFEENPTLFEKASRYVTEWRQKAEAGSL